MYKYICINKKCINKKCINKKCINKYSSIFTSFSVI